MNPAITTFIVTSVFPSIPLLPLLLLPMAMADSDCFDHDRTTSLKGYVVAQVIASL